MAEPLASDLVNELEPDISGIEIEDGEPVDNIFSEKQQQLLIECLVASLSENPSP